MCSIFKTFDESTLAMTLPPVCNTVKTTPCAQSGQRLCRRTDRCRLMQRSVAAVLPSPCTVIHARCARKI